jgi:hypothetical protein
LMQLDWMLWLLNLQKHMMVLKAEHRKRCVYSSLVVMQASSKPLYSIVLKVQPRRRAAVIPTAGVL